MNIGVNQFCFPMTYDVKDAVLAKVETVKENMDDMVAEARHAAEQRREAKEEA